MNPEFILGVLVVFGIDRNLFLKMNRSFFLTTFWLRANGHSAKEIDCTWKYTKIRTSFTQGLTQLPLLPKALQSFVSLYKPMKLICHFRMVVHKNAYCFCILIEMLSIVLLVKEEDNPKLLRFTLILLNFNIKWLNFKWRS